MSDKPLDGRTMLRRGRSDASVLAAYILSDLGAHVIDVPAGSSADIADHDAGAAAPSVLLSPYGLTGRYADAPAHHSAVEAVAGAHVAQYAYTPGPVYLVSPYSTVGQALLAVAGTLAAQLGSRLREPLPVSALQGLLAIESGFYAFGAEYDPSRFAHTPRGQTAFYSTYQAADDWIFCGGMTTAFMIKMLQAAGLEDVLADPRVQEGPRAVRDPAFQADLWERIGRVIREQPRDHWLALFEQLKIPAGPALSLEEAISHPHMQAAGLAEPGTPISRLTNLSAVTRFGDGQPRTAHPTGPLPLSGVRVAELTGYIAGSYVGRLLRDLGASVVKIEPEDGDPFRSSGYGFAAWNHGKKGISVNLREQAGRERLKSLVREADILVTNYRPEALTRMGVGRETLLALNPALIHCTVSAFGETGPLAHLQGFDPVVQAFAGIMKRQGGDDEPVKPQMAATDYLSGMLGAIGVLAARVAQAERGGSYIVRTSLLAAALLLNYAAYEDVRAGRPYRKGGRDFKGPDALNGLHETADGWLLTAAPDTSSVHFPEAGRYLSEGVRHDATASAIVRLAALGVPAVPCLVPEQLPADPHYIDNKLWLTIDEAPLAIGPVTRPAPVLADGPPAEPAPSLGQHNAVEDIWSMFEPARR
jgi:crotonobetainyl-CoA:carnitine CoA-transferase CaiB-like acyl-CoA transferase